MSERLRSLKRVQAVQSRMRDLATWKLGLAEREAAELAAARVAVDIFIAESAVAGPLALLAQGTARGLVAREASADVRRAALAARRLTAETRVKLVERIVEQVSRDERDVAERQRLEDLIEAMLAQAGALPPED